MAILHYIKLQQVIKPWVTYKIETIERILNRLPFLNKNGKGQYRYDLKMYFLYVYMLRQNAYMLRNLRKRWHYDKQLWYIKQKNLKSS